MPELTAAFVDGERCPDCDDPGPHALQPAALQEDGTAQAECDCGTAWTVIL